MSRARRTGPPRWSVCLLAAAVAVAGVHLADPRPGSAASPREATVADDPAPSAKPSDGPVHLGWPALACATGTMTGHVAEPYVVWVSGAIQPCPNVAASPYDQFSIVYYRSDLALRGRVFTHESATGPTSFAGRLRPHGTELVAVCLANGPRDRLACLALERTTDGVELASIPTDDPRVAHAPPSADRPGGGEDPGTTCGNCV